MYNICFDEAEFELETDVVIVGAGACGLTAALAAREAGAEVFILERDPVPSGSTSMSQGLICAGGTKAQLAAGIEDSPELFYNDIMARTNGEANPVIARAVADGAAPTLDWLAENYDIFYDVKTSWSRLFGHSATRMHGLPSMSGGELLGSLIRAAEEIGAELVCDAHVETIYATDEGNIRGVAFRRPDGATERVGCKALIAATCGFGANFELVTKYIKSFDKTDTYRYFGHEGNEGSAVEWGVGLGAQLGCMDAFQGYGSLSMPHGIVVNYDMIMHGGISVNAHGDRFSDELADISGQAITVLNQPENISWTIFDEPRKNIAKHLPEYIELDKLGAFKAAQTIPELAHEIGVSAENLMAALEGIQKANANGTECPFGRSFKGIDSISTAPFHAIRVTGALFHTQGGLMVNSDAQVLRSDGSLLPNFFAGGGAACSISGNGPSGYLPAAGLCTAVTLGRLAGQNAAIVARNASE